MKYAHAMVHIWRNMVVGRSKRQKVALAFLCLVAIALTLNAWQLGTLYLLAAGFVFCFIFPSVVYHIDEKSHERNRSRTH